MLVFKFQECEIRILQGRFTYRRSSLLQNAKLGMWTQEPLTTKGGLQSAGVLASNRCDAAAQMRHVGTLETVRISVTQTPTGRLLVLLFLQVVAYRSF